VSCDGIAVTTDLEARDADAFDLAHRGLVPFRFPDAQAVIRVFKRVITLDAHGETCGLGARAHGDVLPRLPEVHPDAEI